MGAKFQALLTPPIRPFARRVGVLWCILLAGGLGLWALFQCMIGKVKEGSNGGHGRLSIPTGSTREAAASSHSPGLSAGSSLGQDTSHLHDAVEELRSAAYALPADGRLPSHEVRAEMLRLTEEVSQPTWNGIHQTNSWLAEGTTDGTRGDPSNASDESSRRSAYSKAYELAFKSECLKILEDPRTNAVAVAYLRWIADSFHRQISEDPEQFKRLMFDTNAGNHGVYTDTDIDLQSYLSIVRGAGSAHLIGSLDAEIASLELPVTVSEFIVDRVRGQVFRTGLIALKNPHQHEPKQPSFQTTEH